MALSELGRRNVEGAKIYCDECKDEPQLDAKHSLPDQGHGPGIILCKGWLKSLSKLKQNALRNFVDRQIAIETGISINDFRDSSLGAILAREVLLTGVVKYGGQHVILYDHQVDYFGVGRLARRFILCHLLAIQNPAETALNADTIVLFGIGQYMSFLISN